MFNVKKVIKKLKKAVNDDAFAGNVTNIDLGVEDTMITVSDSSKDRKMLKFIIGLFPGKPASRMANISTLGGSVALQYNNNAVLLRVKCQKESTDYRYVCD